jgi:hypothetical protein
MLKNQINTISMENNKLVCESIFTTLIRVIEAAKNCRANLRASWFNGLINC